jgi:dTDP-4-dehydrorhamnose 3,5-epimerase
MKIIDTDIEDVKLMEPQLFGDARGFFMETWRDDQFKELVADVSFVQDNHSKSTQGILRGLHYQIKHPQGKLVRVISGEVFDVAVDLRKGSPTFGRWTGVVLSSENRRLLWVPPGFAHGFYVMSEEAEFVYKCTDYYAPEYERAILWNDPALSIEWPLVDGKSPILSFKDEEGLSFNDSEVYGAPSLT